MNEVENVFSPHPQTTVVNCIFQGTIVLARFSFFVAISICARKLETFKNRRGSTIHSTSHTPITLYELRLQRGFCCCLDNWDCEFAPYFTLALVCFHSFAILKWDYFRLESLMNKTMLLGGLSCYLLDRVEHTRLT